MGLLRHSLDGTVDLVKIAIERLKAFEELALQMNAGGYYVAYSGGKDSDCIRILCGIAGVRHELWHSHTTVDAPETVMYARGIVAPDRIRYPDLSMWRLIVRKRMPPTRKARYCCAELKETGGEGRFIVTGVRRSESYNRSKRGAVELRGKTKADAVIFMHDNDEAKRTVYHCMAKRSPILNPIIDWEDADVWEFLGHHGCRSNPLYECGFRRIGCIGCPMSQGRRGQLWEFERYPKYKNGYVKTFEKMLDERKAAGMPSRPNWGSGEEVFDWWTSGEAERRELDGQTELSIGE